MEHVWDHTFHDRLRVDPTECNILLTGASVGRSFHWCPPPLTAAPPADPPLNPKANRERMVGTMFEKYGFSGAFIQVQAVLTLYAQGLLTGACGPARAFPQGNALSCSHHTRAGLVVDSGDGVTHVVPVVVRPSPLREALSCSRAHPPRPPSIPCRTGTRSHT